ncbi:MAG TPA: ABC transporter permease [Candidatus Limnocylindrales bacterium]|nr:ABC transporter permease [Candidatus Limnocylindrales bacterium]
MADDKLSGGTERAAADPLETGSGTNEALVAATMKTADARSRVSLPETAVLFAVLAVLVIFFSITSQYFLNTANLINILQNVARIGIVACPATLLLIGGQFDLSVGSSSAFVAMVAAIAAATSGSPITPGLPLWAALLAGLIAALLVGMLNAVSVTFFRINALITTLATLAILRGLTKVASDGQTIRLDEFTWLGTSRVLGLPIPVYVFAVVVVVFFFVLRYTTYGRSMYAIGASPTAARLAGIRTDRAIVIAFILSAAMAGLSGLILVSQVGSASPNAGIGLELSVVTAVVLGGASLAGGRGSIVGTTLAVLIVGVLGNGLIQLAVPSYWIDVAGGVLLLVAVGFDQVRVRFSRATN